MHRRKHTWSRNGRTPLLATTLLLVVAVLGAACAQANGPALPAGWTWHRDAQFPINVPVPPGWRVNAYWADYFQGSHCAYAVDLIPPLSEQLYAESPPGGREPELIQVLIVEGSSLGCASAPSVPEGMTLQPQPLTVSGALARLYADNESAQYGMHEVAITRFGEQQYDFNFAYDYRAATPTAGGQEQQAIYMQVLRGFTYTGK